MKHTLQVTLIFVSLFLVCQVFGLYSLKLAAQDVISVNGTTQVKYYDTAIGERPQTQGLESVLYIVIGIAIGTLVLLFLARHRKFNWWKTWFYIAVLISIGITLATYMMSWPFWIPWIAAAALAYIKVFRPNIVMQNITEVLMYAGITILLVPIFQGSMIWVIVLLVIISIYDMYAVWKSKHMVRLAEFTTDAHLFPGLTVAYSEKEGKTQLHNKVGKLSQPSKGEAQPGSSKTGVLGGGDIVFPLIFSGTLMEWLVVSGKAATLTQAFFAVQIVTVTTALMLFGLFMWSKKEKFYPAMPFVTAGCLAGYAIVLLLI